MRTSKLLFEVFYVQHRHICFRLLPLEFIMKSVLDQRHGRLKCCRERGVLANRAALHLEMTDTMTRTTPDLSPIPV
jgi:hypothetical protein